MAKIKCPKCGNELEEGSRFCTSCGSRLVEAPAASAANKPAEKTDKKIETPRTARRQIQPSLTLNSDKNESITLSAKSDNEIKANNASPVGYDNQEPIKTPDLTPHAAPTPKDSFTTDNTAVNSQETAASNRNVFEAFKSQDNAQDRESAKQPVQPQTDSAGQTQEPVQYPHQPGHVNAAFPGVSNAPKQQMQPQPSQQRTSPAPQPNFAVSDKQNLRTSKKAQVKRQTIPEKLLNILASLILCILIIISSISALSTEFINQVLTEKGIVKIVENIDVNNIILNGKPLPEAVINGFGLEYDTLSALGITEEQINTDFKALINMISKGAVKVINAAKKGEDAEGVILATKEEILETLRSKTSALQTIPNVEINDALFNAISEGLDSAGYANGLSVKHIIDSLPESQAKSARANLQTLTAAVASVKYVKYGFAAISVLLLSVLLILNKRRFRLSLMLCAIDSAIISAGLMFTYFAYDKAASLVSVPDNTKAVITAVKPVAVEYSLKYGIIFAAAFVVLTVLAIISAISSSSKKKSN